MTITTMRRIIITTVITTITSTERGGPPITRRRRVASHPAPGGRALCRGHQLALALVSLAVMLGASAPRADAEVSVQGDRSSVRLEASNAPLSEVLSALEVAFSIRYRTAAPLDQPISGTYRGSLRHVLARVLDGFNYYVADTATDKMEITVIGKPAATAVMQSVASPAAAVSQAQAPAPILHVPPPTVAEIAARRQKAHHRRPPS